MKSAYQIIRRPVITEKGLDVKETEGTLVFDQCEGRFSANCQLRGQGTPPRKVLRLPSRLEEGLRKAEVGRKNAGVRSEFIELLAASY